MCSWGNEALEEGLFEVSRLEDGGPDDGEDGGRGLFEGLRLGERRRLKEATSREEVGSGEGMEERREEEGGDDERGEREGVTLLARPNRVGTPHYWSLLASFNSSLSTPLPLPLPLPVPPPHTSHENSYACENAFRSGGCRNRGRAGAYERRKRQKKSNKGVRVVRAQSARSVPTLNLRGRA